MFIQQPAGAGEEYDLVRFDGPDQFPGRDIGVDVHNLAGRILAQAGDDGQDTPLRHIAYRFQVDPLNMTDQAQFVFIEVITYKHAMLNALCAHALLLQRMYQVAVGSINNRARHFHDFGGGHPQALPLLRHYRGRLQGLVQLWTGSVQNDRHQTQVTQKGQRGSQRSQLLLHHRPTNLDHRELQAVTAELLQVITRFTAGAQLAQYLVHYTPDLSHRS